MTANDASSLLDVADAHEMIDDFCINVKVKSLQTRIQVSDELMFGLKRDLQAEVLLPIQVFEKFGVSQPAWFLI